MANQTDLRVKISADLGDIKAGLGLLRGELAKVKQQAAASAPNMSSWSAGIANVRRQVGDLFGAWVSFRAVGGIIRGVFDSFDRMDRIDEMRQMVALSSEDLSKFAYAAQFSGVELESLGKGFYFFERNLIKNSALLKQLGVDAPTTAGKLRQLMDVFAALPDGSEKAALASELFGSKLGANLIPLLNEGSQKFDELSDAAARTGNVFSDEATAGAARLNDNMDTLKATLAGVFNVTAQQLAPAMSAYTGETVEAAKGNQAAAETGKFLANVFKVIAVGAVLVKNVVEAVVNVLAFLADAAIGTGKVVLGALGGAFTTVGDSMKAFLTGGPLAAFQAFTDGVKKNGASLLAASKESAQRTRAGWSAMKDGVSSAVSDVGKAFSAAFADGNAAAGGRLDGQRRATGALPQCVRHRHADQGRAGGPWPQHRRNPSDHWLRCLDLPGCGRHEGGCGPGPRVERWRFVGL